MLPLLLLGAAEWTLRVLHHGRSRSLLKTAHEPYHSFSVVNTGFYSRFFPKNMEDKMAATMNWGFAAPKTKERHACRILILGESAALGDVPSYAFSFSRILQIMLETAFPDKHIEVYNLACCSINSHVMRLAAQECAPLAPDFLVVYMGNNEYVGPFGPGWSPTGTPSSIPLARMRLSLASLWLVQSLESVVSYSTRMVDSFSADPIVLIHNLTKTPYGAKSKEGMYENYARNVDDVCRSARSAGAKTILCTVAGNIRDMPPFGVCHGDGVSRADLPAWDYALAEGTAAQARGASGDTTALQEALNALEKAQRLDPLDPELQFRLGQCYLALNDVDRAKEAFSRARDYDCVPLRMDSRANEIIRTACQRMPNETLMGDVLRKLEAGSPNGIPGNGIFYDYVHFLFPGHYLVASAIFDAMKGPLGKPDAAALPEEECKRQLGMSPFLYARHLQAALDELEAYHQVNALIQTEWLHAQVAQAEVALTPDSADEARARLREAIALRPNDFYLTRTLVEVDRDSGRIEDALLQAKALVAQFGQRADAHVLLANILDCAGRVDEALQQRKWLGTVR